MTEAPEPTDADELFARFLANVEQDPSSDFEEFVDQHAEVEDELRELHSLWLQFEDMSHELAARELGRGGAASDHEEAPRHDRYRVEGVVGTGGMGVVFQVRDAVLDRTLAMKVVRTRAGMGSAGTTLSRSLARFLDEARITSKLDHPGVVPIHELGRDERGRAFFTMRLVEGETLVELLRRTEEGADSGGGGARGHALGVLRRTCETMAYAHSRGVIHRDLKPANVMVGRFGEVYVMDWGLARDMSEESGRSERGQRLAEMLFESPATVAPDEPLATLDGDVVGTPAYMPPEQARGELADLDPTADVYALGAMLYHVCAGRAPFAEVEGAQGKLSALRAGSPVKLERIADDLSPELVAICERAMQREPERRYSDVGELGRDLSAFLEGRVVLAYESGPWAEFRKWVGRNRRFAGVALVAVLASLAAVGGVFATLFVRDVERSVSERFQDLERLYDWETELRGLWPALPSELPRLRDFVARAERLVERNDSHEIPEVGAGADEVDRWRQAKQRTLLLAVRELADPDTGEIARVQARIDTARSIETLEQQPEFERAWDAVADRGRAPAKRSGWLPRGVDPQSGFEVFEHLPSASIERLRGELSELLATPLHPLDPHCGVLLVALPATRVDPLIGVKVELNLPPELAGLGHREVEPFLIAKYELTQGQADRLGFDLGPGERPLRPKRGLSANDADALGLAAGLDLPTTDQWLTAAAGGVDSVVWWGGEDDQSRWSEFENLDEQSPKEVGSAAANPFGLYDLLGNVQEWGGENSMVPDGGLDPDRRRAHGPDSTWGLEQAPQLWQFRASPFNFGLDDRRPQTGVRFVAKFSAD